MHILYVVHLLPYVPSGGGTTRTYHLVRAATEIADVTLIVAEDDPVGPRVEETGVAYAAVHIISPPDSLAHTHRASTPRRPMARAWKVFRKLIGDDPFPEGALDRQALCATVRDVLAAGRFDLVVCHQLGVAAAIRGVLEQWGGPCVVDLMDVLSVLEIRRQQSLRRQRRRRRPSVSGWRLVSQLRALERAVLRSYTRVVAVSEVDARLLQRLLPSKRVDVIPNGVDVGYFGAVTRESSDHSTDGAERIVFIGSLWYPPNIDGLRFFVQDIWPVIRRRRPQVHLDIVGNAPTAEILALAEREDIDVFPSVADVRPFLADAAVVVVPLRLGTGTRLKILEALAARRPVVTTTVGAEGLELEAGRDLLLADEPTAFADSVVRLLEEPVYARELAERGQETVRRRYSWDSVTAHFQQLLGQFSPTTDQETMRPSAPAGHKIVNTAT